MAYLLWPENSELGATKPLGALAWQQAAVSNPFGPIQQGLTPPAAPLAASPAEPITLAGTSLAGTQADGDWGVDSQGQLRASHALRQRFDYYLSLIGEKPLTDIRILVRKAAEQDLKEPALGQVMALWERYVQLQQHSWKQAVDLRQSATWSAALIERQTVRRQILGADWAHAFYAQEERQLQDMLSRLNGGQSSASEPPKPDPSPMHPLAKEREAAVQAQWQLWDQRLATAKTQVEALRQAPELSAPQRLEAVQQYLSSQFQGTDLSRAKALLGL